MTEEGIISRLVAKNDRLERDNRKLKNEMTAKDDGYYKLIDSINNSVTKVIEGPKLTTRNSERSVKD